MNIDVLDSDFYNLEENGLGIAFAISQPGSYGGFLTYEDGKYGQWKMAQRVETTEYSSTAGGEITDIQLTEIEMESCNLNSKIFSNDDDFNNGKQYYVCPKDTNYTIGGTVYSNQKRTIIVWFER